MNRRNFLRSILVAGASFSILPGAGRLWKASRETPFDPRTYTGEVTLEWVQAPYAIEWLKHPYVLHPIASLNELAHLAPVTAEPYRLYRITPRPTSCDDRYGPVQSQLIGTVDPKGEG